jgi:predicted transcriptional regulator
MRAMDVMTTEVISVDPDASVQALAALLSERGISWVPLSMPTIEWWHRQRG